MTGNTPVRAYVDPACGKTEKAEGGVVRIRVNQGSDGHTYLAQYSLACSKVGLRPGDLVLVLVKARVASGGHGSLIAKLQLAAAPYTAACGTAGFDLAADWKEYPLVFHINTTIPDGKGSLVMFCGQVAQTVEVAGIRAFRYPPGTDASKFPRIHRSYEGREPDAAWRQAALARIERERKRDLSLRILDAGGKPISNGTVTLTLLRHEFAFGTAVPASFFSSETEDGRRFRQIVDRLFSAVVFENDLKDFEWGARVSAAHKAAHCASLDHAFEWLEQRHIAVRGHYLMQVAIPPNLRNISDENAIRAHFLDTMRERMTFVKDRVREWDVINHPVAWSGAEMLNRRPGLEHLDREVLAEARRLTKLPLLVNEDQLFRPGHQSDGTFEYLRALHDAGLVIDGLGNQAHIDDSYLPSPKHIYEVSDRFARVVPRQVVTEFDVVAVDDEQLAADYTRDLLITCFSHPAYSGFFLWGFWEGSHWKPEAASWNQDWTIRKRGEVLEEWLGRRWRTEVTVRPDADGIVRWRGFPGWYGAAGEGISARQDIRVTQAAPRAELRLPR